MATKLTREGWAAEQSEFVNGYWELREDPVAFAVNGTMTGDISLVANMLEAWLPATGSRFLLRGARLTIVCTTTCTGTGADVLFLCDQGLLTKVIAPMAAISRSMPAGTVVGDPIEFNLGAGIYSQAVSQRLAIAANGTIGTGVLRVTGILYGDEVIG